MQNIECLSILSHELRNPLTLIYSSLQLLEMECPAVRESGLWAQIRQDMLDTIQLLRSMTASFGSLEQGAVSVPDFVEGMAASFRPAARMRQISFDAEVSGELSGAVLTADVRKLREAVTNLLVNALDAADPARAGESSPDAPNPSESAGNDSGSPEPAGPGKKAIPGKKAEPDKNCAGIPELPPQGRITLSAVRDGADICIHVKDNGRGIPQERLATLFDSYVTYRAGGFGLGLGIARSIAQLHGGSLTVTTCTQQPGTYTDFCLRLPLAAQP